MLQWDLFRLYHGIDLEHSVWGFRTWVDIHVATSEDATQRGGFLEVASFCSMDCSFKEKKPEGSWMSWFLHVFLAVIHLWLCVIASPFFLHTVLSVTIMTNNISIDYDELYIYVYRYFYPYTSIFRCFISIQCLSSAFPAWLWRFRTLLFLWGWSSYPTGSWGHPHRRGLRLLRRFDDFANLAKKLSKRLKETLKHNLLRTVVYTASFFLPVVTNVHCQSKKHRWHMAVDHL